MKSLRIVDHARMLRQTSTDILTGCCEAVGIRKKPNDLFWLHPDEISYVQTGGTEEPFDARGRLCEAYRGLMERYPARVHTIHAQWDGTLADRGQRSNG